MQLLSCMRVIKSLVFNGPLNTSWTVVNPMVLFINIFRKYQILTVNHFAVEYCVRISIGFFLARQACQGATRCIMFSLRVFIFLTIRLGTNYLRMCTTDLHRIFGIGKHMGGDD